MTHTSPSDIRVEAVRISNYRALRNVEVLLGDLTVLIGPNNSGKTSFLEALSLALSPLRRGLAPDDVHLTQHESTVPDERTIVIDVLLRPVNEQGAVADEFPKGNFWVGHFGLGISQDEVDDHQFVAIRTAFPKEDGDYVLQRQFLKEWLPFSRWLEAEASSPVRGKQLEPLAAQFVDAKRDLSEELHRQGSFWGRLTGDLNLNPDDIESIETQLETINTQIVAKSEVLGFVKDNLKGVQYVVNPGQSKVELAPVPSQFRHITQGINVNFTSYGKQSFPLARHGMGTRSLSSLLVFGAYVSWKRLQAHKVKKRFHPLLALEEPEAHLHPQTQRSLFHQIKEIPGQRIVSSHSPYFVSQVPLEDLRLFLRDADGVRVNSLNLQNLNTEERRKVYREVLNSRGHLLFARAVVLFEGETEEQFLPRVAEAYWKRSLDEWGVCFLGVGGKGNYYPFAFLAQELGIRFYILSDGEPDALKDVAVCLEKLGHSSLAGMTNIKTLPNGHDLEGYLLEAGYQAEAEQALQSIGEDVDQYIALKHGQRRKGGALRDYQCPEGRHLATLDALRGCKTSVALAMAEAIVSCADPLRKVPPLVKELLDQIALDLQFTTNAVSAG